MASYDKSNLLISWSSFSRTKGFSIRAVQGSPLILFALILFIFFSIYWVKISIKLMLSYRGCRKTGRWNGITGSRPCEKRLAGPPSFTSFLFKKSRSAYLLIQIKKLDLWAHVDTNTVNYIKIKNDNQVPQCVRNVSLGKLKIACHHL